MRQILAVATTLLVGLTVGACGSSGGGAAGGTAAPTAPASTVLRSSTGQPELLLTPPGTVRGLVVFMHGLGSTENELLVDSGLVPVRDALLGAGYAIITSYAHGDNAGNPASIQDQRAALADAQARLPGIADVNILAFSMGGLDALLVAAGKSFPGLHAVALLSPATDQATFMGGGLAGRISLAFDNPQPDALPGIFRTSDPLAQPAARYRGPEYAFWHSPQDDVVPYDQSERMVALLKTAGISPAFTPLTGRHGDLSALDPAAVVDLFDRR